MLDHSRLKIAELLEHLNNATQSKNTTLSMPLHSWDKLVLVASAGCFVTTESLSLSTPDVASVRAFQTGEQVVISDYISYCISEYLDVQRGIKSVISLPVKNQNETLAVITLSSAEKDHFTPELMSYLNAYCLVLGALLKSVEFNDHPRGTTSTHQLGEERYRQLVELSPDGVLVSTGGVVVYANPDAREIWETSDSQELVGINALDLVHPDSLDLSKARQAQTREGLPNLPVAEIKIVTLKGNEKFVESVGAGIEFEDQPGAVFVVRDVTERKLAENAVRHSVARNLTLLEGAPQGILAADAEGRIIFGNAQLESLFGYSRDELVGQKVEVLLSEGLRSQHTSHRSEYSSNPRTRPMGVGLQIAGLRKDGTSFPVEISLNSVDGQAGTLIIAHINDDTQRRSAEEALRVSEERFRVLCEGAPIGIFLSDAEGYCTYTNGRWQEASRMTATDAAGFGWCAQMSLEERSALVKEWAQAANDSRIYQREHMISFADGTERWISGHSAGIFSPSGELTGYVGSRADITERKLMEEALRQSERTNEAWMRAQPDIMLRMDRAGILVDVRAPSDEELETISKLEHSLKFSL